MEATFRDRAVLLGETLVLADLHVGKARAANVDLPLGERDHLVERFETLLSDLAPEEVVLAGDVLHSFDRVPTAAQETLTALTRTARAAGSRLVVVRGNHDTMLSSLWSGTVHDEYELSGVGGVGPDGGPGTVLVCHGHAEPAGRADCYVVGHDHPTLTVEGQKWHCYLYAEAAYQGGDVLMLPAFSHLLEGVSLNRRFGTTSLMSPLVTDLERFRPVVRDEAADETREFPPLGEFRELL